MKKTKHITSVLLILSVAFFSACKKNKAEIPAATVVYTAGINNGKPFITKDGTALTPLALRYNQAAEIWGFDIADNGDIYANGEERVTNPVDFTFIYYNAFWKNGVLQSLTTPTAANTKVTDIKIMGNDVYLVGYRNNKPTVWKNGVTAFDITVGTNPVQATSIFVTGNDVYTCGEEYNTKWVAKIWKNGTVHSILSDGINSTFVKSIFINGTDVYACGYELNGSNNLPVIWKNAVKSYLTNARGMAQKIIVSNNDVYVAGYENFPGTNRQIGTYWKNGIPFTVAGLAYNSPINSITIKDGDVYVAGYEQSLPTSKSIAKYWKNGTAVVLSDGTSYAYLNSIIVK